MKAIDQTGLLETNHDRLGTGHPDHAHRLATQRFDLLLEVARRLLDALGMWQHRGAEIIVGPIRCCISAAPRGISAPYAVGIRRLASPYVACLVDINANQKKELLP